MAYDREEVLKYHIGGKVAVALPKPLKTKDDLCLAYTPGVAHAVKAIAENKDAAWDVTAKRNLVAVVSDGTAILGLGDLGAAASVPVMEGKAVLFKAFADVDAQMILNRPILMWKVMRQHLSAICYLQMRTELNTSNRLTLTHLMKLTSQTWCSE